MIEVYPLDAERSVVDDGDIKHPDDVGLTIDTSTDDEDAIEALNRRLTLLDERASDGPHLHTGPVPITEHIASAAARLIDRDDDDNGRYDAYADLGGRRREQRTEQYKPPVGPVLETVFSMNIQPWHEAVALAVDGFGLNRYSVKDLSNTLPRDTRKVQLLLYSFMERIATVRRLIQESDGVVEYGYCDSLLSQQFHGHSQEEMRYYSDVLAKLKTDIEASGLGSFVRTNLNYRSEQPTDQKNATRRRLLHEARLVQKGRMPVLQQDGGGVIQLGWKTP